MRMVKGLANTDAAKIVGVRADQPFISVDDLWRRAGVPSASLVELAEADAFQPSLKLARREALWAIKALRDEPPPLFAAATARENKLVPEIHEPNVALRPMTAGGEVVRRLESRRSSVVAVPDRSAPVRCATRPGERQHPPPIAEIDDVDSSCLLPLR
jgi:DNA polymerase III alpha subunit